MLGKQYGRLDLRFLSAATTVADGTSVLLVRTVTDPLFAVVLCSASASPDLVATSMRRAHAARSALTRNHLSSHILEPLMEGRVQELSYAVLPFCEPLSESRVGWWLQRSRLRPRLLNWLRGAVENTLCDVNNDAVDRCFAKPLQHLSSLAFVGSNLRSAALKAMRRLDAGTWNPKYVIMHGDLWKGNVLIRKSTNSDSYQDWASRFVIIDWAGSEVKGHAIYDLIRLAESMKLAPNRLRQELAWHCHILDCRIEDAESYLLAALAHVEDASEYLPPERFADLANSCLATLRRALN